MSRLCASLDTQVQAFLTRRLDAQYPYLFVDARYEHIREDERVQSKAVELLEAAEEEILAFYDFPPEHWRQIYSTNPLERLNKELKRRSAVVGIFPNRQAAIRLMGALLAEQNDEWIVGRHYFSEPSMRRMGDKPPADSPSALAA